MIPFILTLLAPLFGGVLYGAERIVRARMQRRLGPPLLQPFYDMFKLIDKVPTIVHPLHTLLGIMHFLALWGVVALTIYGANLLYVIFMHLFSTILLILAGFSVRSIYSHMGANRELLTMLAYEPILILVASGFYLINGSFEISTIRESSPQIGILFLLFLAFLLIIPIKLKKSPFDAAEAHQEIVGGVEIEYGGVFFEFLYMAKWLEYVFIYLLLILFAGNSTLLASVLMIGVFLLVNLVDNSTARVRMTHLLKITLIIGLTLSIVNLVGVVYAL